MKERLSLVKESPPFYGISDDKPYTPLKCCASEQVLYEDGECILHMGESVNKALVLLRGKVCVIQENFWRRQEHIYHIKEGELFGQPCSCTRIPVLPVNVVVEGGCETSFLNYQRMITFCPLARDLHTRFIHNMSRLISEHNAKLEDKLEHVCRKTIREKPLPYLLEQTMAKGGRNFDIPHNRQELAEYPRVDRSAMSGELNKMRAKGILDSQKNYFVLHDRGVGDRREEA